MSTETVPVEVPFWTALSRHYLVILELALVLVLVHLYQLENVAFSRILTLAAAGFVVSISVPLAYRLRFFTLLSLGGILWVFGPLDGAWLIGLGLALIAVANLPIPMAYRVAGLVAVGIGLAALRSGLASTPWSQAIWPVLGSMFMFRMILYLRATPKLRAEGGFWGALAYFFMLPNAAFPLFPVVDFQGFRRTWFDRDEAGIYQQGVLWIARGLTHLVLYRFVYLNLLGDPVDVVRLGDLVQFMLATFLLYLHVSGQFHLIVGVLHLFGFRLPETHKLYYLAHSFTELWRRINIYWTEFMMKVVFYPTWFKAKRLGPAPAFTIATAVVFATTWILHSYQWFWLTNGFPLTAPDFLFWAILGALVIRGGLKELHAKKAARKQTGAWDWRLGVKAATTFCGFCFLWSLWSAESIGQWVWMLGAAVDVDAKGVLLLLGVFATIALLGGWDWQTERPTTSKWVAIARLPEVRTLAPLLVLLVLAQPFVSDALPQGPVRSALRSLTSTSLNARDAALQHRGYYEQLEIRQRQNTPAFGAFGIERDAWQTPADVGIIRERRDHLARDLHPSMDITWNGNRFTTNEFGMRDQPYPREKPPGTLRIALLGPSHVMGNGVGDGETFEALVEERLNREFRHERYQRFEILNFAVDGYTLIQQLALLEHRVFDFSPDAVLMTHYHAANTMAEKYLAGIVWNDVTTPHEPVRALLAEGGLRPLDREGLPLPFEPWRRVAKSLGIAVRMPWHESRWRVRRIVDDANGWALTRIVEVTRAHGVTPLILTLDAVLPEVPPGIPNQDEIEAAQVPVLNLFDVFPEAEKAELRVAPWDDHPNARGHQLVADRLYAELVPHLTNVNGR